MTKLRCCFCQQELEEETFSRGRVFVSCNNPNCIISDWGGCSKQIITELIRTRKALDVAVDALKNIGTSYPRITDIAMQDKANKALEQITALTKGGDNE